MVNEEVVRNTIQKMRDAGLPENVIASTLQDLGLSPAQMQSYLAPSTGSSRPPAPNVPVSNSPPRKEEDDDESAFSDLDHEVLATRTSEKVMQQMEERNLLNEQTSALKDNITHVALEQHGQQLMDTHNAVVELHDKLDSANLETMSNRLSVVNSRIDQLQKDVSDAKALLGAVQTLMQKILETNQQLLFETKNRK